MDLVLTPEERAFQEEVRNFIRDRLPDDVRERTWTGARMDKEGQVRWEKILSERGWLAPSWPVEHGGTGWTPLQCYLFEEEMEAAFAPPPMPFGVNMVGPVIIAFGTGEQKRRFLPRILSSDDWWCQGYSEPGGRLGSGVPQDPGGARRRPLRRQRPEDLDHRRAARGLDLLPGPHEPGGKAPAGDLVPSHRHALARDHGAPDPDHGRRGGDQRHLLRGRPGPGREPRRRGGQGLDLCEVPARPRAHRHRRGRTLEGPDPADPRARGERDEPRPPPRRRPPVPGTPRRDRGGPDGPRVHDPAHRLRDERGNGPPAPRRRSSRSRGPRSSRPSPTC